MPSFSFPNENASVKFYTRCFAHVSSRAKHCTKNEINALVRSYVSITIFLLWHNSGAATYPCLLHPDSPRYL